MSPPARQEDPRLSAARKSVYGMGDFTVNTALVSLSLIYTAYFLTTVGDLRPALAGLVPLVGRTVDAFTDPAMGRLSDLTRWKLGRRRPYFLIGAIPFGASFAMLWLDLPLASQAARFAYYAAVYVLMSISMTIVSVPYLALLPEMALGYDARTSLNTYRNVGSVVGIFAAVSIRPVAEFLGGGSYGFALAGSIFGVLLALPWFAVFCVTWERPEFQRRKAQTGFVEGVRVLAGYRTYRQLTGLYLCGRMAMDLIGAMLILYFTYWLGRSRDFEITMLAFFATVLIALPAWLRVSRRFDKATIFIVGSVWWACSQVIILLAQPDWPRWTMFVFAPLAGIGFAVVDLMPWSMIGDVIDEDELASGERREDLYNGFFMFVRKLGGSIGVALALAVLDLSGFDPNGEQTQTTLTTLRLLTSVGPALLIGISVWIAWGYPLTRAAHAQVLEQLAVRGE